MESICLQAGEVLYLEGDAADSVYYVETGSIVTQSRSSTEPNGLFKMGPGALIGEHEVIIGAPRASTTTAAIETTLVKFLKQEFLLLFGPADGIGVKLLRAISERTAPPPKHEANEDSGADLEKPKSVVVTDNALTLFGDSPETIEEIGKEGIAINRLPFFVGLAGGLQDRSTKDRLSMRLNGAQSQLSRTHFRIEVSRKKTLVIRDMMSLFGCRVNGRLVIPNQHFNWQAIVPLKAHDNEIIAGGQNSIARFNLHWKRPKPELTFIEDQLSKKAQKAIKR